MKTSVQRLVEKLRDAGFKIPATWTFRRVYAGYWQRAAGAWSWRIGWDSGELGSCYTVRQCLMAKEFSDGPYGEVFPEGLT